MQSSDADTEPINVDEDITTAPASPRSTPSPLPVRRGPVSWGEDVETERQARRSAWIQKPNNNSGWTDPKRPRYIWREDERLFWFYVREDWTDLPMSWNGRADRDPSFDTLDALRWSELQLYRCSPQAADSNAGPPTFTGPQVAERCALVRQSLREMREREHRLEAELSELRSQIHGLETARDNLKDLDVVAAGLVRP
ncbi:hypothetical protein V5O48_014122 [Marasmius crinis-equi]|uniref:Uncharacterized protein n=1 Tax=Marasmius crinis-equi TaxID=585013 RepID=A0ABR3EY70_9AGAR